MGQGTNTEKGGKKNEKISATRARGVIALIFLLLVFQTVTFTLHKCGGDEPSVQYADGNSPGGYQGSGKFQRNGTPGYSPGNYQRGYSSGNYQRGYSSVRTPQHFKFNPNTISPDSLCLLGFSEKQALTIIHYREKGGIFRRKEDFKKMYVVDDARYVELLPYITIPQGNTSISGNKTALQIHNSSANNYGTENAGIMITKQNSDFQNFARDRRERASSRDSALNHKILRRFVPQNSAGALSDSKIAQAPRGQKTSEKIYIDLNEADSAALVSLRGIGAYYARKILSYREKLGSFARPEQLMEIDGIDEERYNMLKEQIFVHPSGIKKFSIAEMAEKNKDFLKRHPYIGAYAARGIALFISQSGAEACTLDNLVRASIISATVAEKLRPYVR
jgi:competence protein ComEA